MTLQCPGDPGGDRRPSSSPDPRSSSNQTQVPIPAQILVPTSPDTQVRYPKDQKQRVIAPVPTYPDTHVRYPRVQSERVKALKLFRQKQIEKTERVREGIKKLATLWEASKANIQEAITAAVTQRTNAGVKASPDSRGGNDETPRIDEHDCGAIAESNEGIHASINRASQGPSKGEAARQRIHTERIHTPLSLPLPSVCSTVCLMDGTHGKEVEEETMNQALMASKAKSVAAGSGESSRPVTEIPSQKLSQCHACPHHRGRSVHVRADDQLVPGDRYYEEDLEGRRFILEFAVEGDMRHAIRGGPWRYRGDAFLVTKLEVQFHKIPIYLLSKNLAKQLGEKVGDVLLVDVSSHGNVSQKFIRARVLLPLHAALQKSITLTDEEMEEEVVTQLCPKAECRTKDKFSRKEVNREEENEEGGGSKLLGSGLPINRQCNDSAVSAMSILSRNCLGGPTTDSFRTCLA
ncbi:unnamed protein product [Miscanthus lutarioriparius]|uniref:DUF4283 domain-containing protein n=1 Tax=Miscanthus lutarioriparius TaxID=422564 RepID=A0A811QDF4_9POAL|nr:unnamed protein product [Miscanthus lutarioriparius]